MTAEPPNPPRPPVPVWMGLLFSFGPVVGCAFFSWVDARGPYPGSQAVFGAISGLILAVPLCGGLTLAAYYYSSVPARLLAGVVCGVLILTLILAVLYAGCKCGNNIYIDRP